LSFRISFSCSPSTCHKNVTAHHSAHHDPPPLQHPSSQHRSSELRRNSAALQTHLTLSVNLSVRSFCDDQEAIPATGRGGLYGYEMLRIPHCLDSRLTDGGKIVSPANRQRSTRQKLYFSASGIHFC
jgi:hypothetical protein